LTPRELELLALLGQGLTNAQIGAHLNIAAGTVRVHLRNLMGKLALASRSEAVVYAAKMKIET